MLTKRIIPCLDVNNGRVVKGVNFVDLRDAGDPVEIGKAYDKAGADELVFLDITASSDARETVVDMVRKVAETVFIPFTVGGGIRTVEDFKVLLREGADKISINSSAIANPQLIRDAADKFGSQCVVVAIDARKREDGTIRIYIVNPYQMAAQQGKYYLICNYDKYDDISNYRIDRIRNIQLLDEKCKPFESLTQSGHQRLNLADYMKEHIYMYSGENSFVKFRIARVMLSDVIDMFGKEVVFSDETDTHVSVSVKVNERAAEQFAKSYGPDVIILQPERLREKMKNDMKRLWEAYRDMQESREA